MYEVQPILDRDLAARSERALAALWTELDKPIELPVHERMTPEWVRAAFSLGLPGPTIAFAHRALAARSEAHADRSRELLVECVEAGRALWMAPGLIQGFAGLGYTIEHLKLVGLVDGVDDVANTIAGRVREAMAPGGLTFDHFFGTAGIVLYGLERARAAGNTDVLDDALARLAAAAAHATVGVTWKKVPDTRWMAPALVARYPDGHVDTGMSQGVAGVLAALAAAVQFGASDATKRLLRDGLEWLWSVRLDKHERQWSIIVGEATGGRGWCRGDLGIAAAAFVAGLALGDSEWTSRACSAARRALDRRDWSRDTITLCHGSSGAAHLAHRLFVHTGDATFADAARRACGDLLDGLAREPLAATLLGGAAGVALALLSLLDPTRLEWDHWFLPGSPAID